MVAASARYWRRDTGGPQVCEQAHAFAKARTGAGCDSVHANKGEDEACDLGCRDQVGQRRSAAQASLLVAVGKWQVLW